MGGRQGLPFVVPRKLIFEVHSSKLDRDILSKRYKVSHWPGAVKTAGKNEGNWEPERISWKTGKVKKTKPKEEAASML